jgi:hypothetical protein
MITRKNAPIALFALIESVLLVPKVAHAGDITAITLVGFANESWGHALFATGSNNVNYYAYLGGGGTGCTPSSLDDVKLWQSMLQAAYLSGRNVQIGYTSGACGNLITSINER